MKCNADIQNKIKSRLGDYGKFLIKLSENDFPTVSINELELFAFFFLLCKCN